jgi:hypothetical protein
MTRTVKEIQGDYAVANLGIFLVTLSYQCLGNDWKILSRIDEHSFVRIAEPYMHATATIHRRSITVPTRKQLYVLPFEKKKRCFCFHLYLAGDVYGQKTSALVPIFRGSRGS